MERSRLIAGMAVITFRGMDQEAIDRLSACLESARRRPAMYFGRVEIGPAVHWLNGFSTAVSMTVGGPEPSKAREEVTRARGWEWTARHPSAEMIDRGMAAAAVIDELLAIECEVLRRLFGPR
jgi:hypothetical protein